jgi:hypothetical protein
MSTPNPAPVLYPAQGTQGPVLYLNPYTGRYTASRSYGLRMQRGYAAGLPQVVARRGTPSVPGLSEYQLRQQRFLQRYGFEQQVWRRLYDKYIGKINAMASPAAQITPMIISQVLQNTPVTGLGIDWLENRLAQKLEDMQEWRADGKPAKNTNPNLGGYVHYWQEESARMFTPIELWWYH